ncbi:MAG: 3-deoxy-manno-octulosonate cytidylyltransferase [Pirellulaceae bacterium]
MMNARTLVVIPARLASTRLPEKLLLKESGKSVLEHTYEAARRAEIPSAVWVATDHPRIAQEVAGFGGVAKMTSPQASSGTDRLAELASLHPEYDLWINVQGDEPEIAPASLDRVARLLVEHPQASVATLATPIRRESDYRDPSCVKVVRDIHGGALYFSRSPIPWDRDGLLAWPPPEDTPPQCLQHLGIYAYKRDFLLQLNQLPPSRLESTEKLEQLRFLEAGHRIVVDVIDQAPRGIDTRDDYEAFLSRQRNG